MNEAEQRACDERHNRIDSRLQHIERVIDGNGTPGLRTQLACIQSKVDSIGAEQGKLSAKVSWLMIGAGSLGGLLGNADVVLKFLGH